MILGSGISEAGLLWNFESHWPKSPFGCIPHCPAEDRLTQGTMGERKCVCCQDNGAAATHKQEG